MSQVTAMQDVNLSGASASNAEFRHRITDEPSKRWEQLWVRASEAINPIVVKEVRQSLNSKQFTVSFGLTIIASIAWTLIAISVLVPRIYYMPAGPQLLTGYFCILTLPLMVIIPFSAFRSLIAETEDSTFELLSISALSATQIVYGKMASACLQIVLYLSALAPCIVLTYLLRGVELFTVLFVLGLTVVFSVCETTVALLIASAARTRLFQAGGAVLVLAALLIAFTAWISSIVGSGIDTFSSPPKEIYIVLFAMVTLVSVAVSLLLKATAAAIDFPSENHSTTLRWRILLLAGLSYFWVLIGIVAAEETVIGAIYLVGVFIVLMFLGSLMTGELGIISPRAQRTLPTSFLGRVFRTWFYPGAGLGYVFLISMFAAMAASLACFEYFYSTLFRFDRIILSTGFLLLCYLTIYVGLIRLIMFAVNRNVQGRMVISVAMLIIVLLASHLVPMLIVYYWNDYRQITYDWHQSLNIFWTIGEIINNRNFDLGMTPILLSLCAVMIFGLNLVLCSRDVMLVRVLAPPRVREETKPALEKSEVASKNPFDD